MKTRAASHVARVTCALTLAMIPGVVVLGILNAVGADNVSFAIVGATSSIVGGVVASRRPDHPVGWLFLAAALISTLRGLAAEYATYGILTDPGSLPAPQAAAWFAQTTEFLGPVLLFVLIPLYFPTGRPVTRRWGIVAWLALGVLPLATAASTFLPGEAVAGTGIQNPLGVEALGPVLGIAFPITFAWYIGLIFASAASLVVRYRRSWGVERQQIKWFTFAAAFIPIWFITNRPVEEAVPAFFQVIDALVIAAVPVAAGIAILRYRLYDIDVIINRTLVYGALTASLVAVYLGVVVSLQTVLRALTGEGSQLAIVVSTLTIAALFNPLRRRIQGFIDRRFYRKKYDAAQTLEAYAGRLRDGMDLDRLTLELTGVVQETVQPRHVSLWLRDPGR